MINEDKLYRFLKLGSGLVFIFFTILLFPQIQLLIVEFVSSRFLGRSLYNQLWMERIHILSLFAVVLFGVFCVMSTKKAKDLWTKYNSKYLIQVSVFLVLMSVVIRIIMYIKNRTLWVDEAAFAESIVNRNWAELLTPPLSNGQSAPLLYAIAVKGIGSVFGYPEFSLRLFSLLAFIAFIFCLVHFLKNIFNLNNNRTAFIVLMCALLPSYIWYSNEFKPYMSDALFAILTLMTYFYYKQNKIKLPVLTVLYLLFLGFSSPAIFFIAGTLIYDFIFAIIKKDIKQILCVTASGAIILILFVIYYLWWMTPVVDFMEDYWGRPGLNFKTVIDIWNIFNSKGNTWGAFTWIFVPFAVVGFYSLIKTKDIIAGSAAISLFLTFIASAIGRWPLTGRLWLFLPVIVFIFAPFGFGFIFNKTKYKKIWSGIGFAFPIGMILFLSINSLAYTGSKAFYYTQEANPLIAYVKNNIKEDEMLYVFPATKNVVLYKNGYDSLRIGNVTKDNIIFGEDNRAWRETALAPELQLITEHDKVYLLFSHHLGSSRGIENGLDVLRNYGTVTQIMNVYDTPLYYFSRTHIDNNPSF